MTRKAMDNDSFKSIYQLSYQHCGLGIDSIVLTRESDSELYDKILIYRDKKMIFEYGDTNLEVLGSPFSVFIEHEILTCKEYFYIFKLFNAPGPYKYLIIKLSKDIISYFGTTKSSTAEIFGDIDYDGKFEIGGFEWYCETDDSTCQPKDLYNVFEVDSGFPVDTTLTKYFKQFIKR
ncbi:MAG: hypothetical protein Q8T08_13520 [Ignavibacteria bacterium]|nr:hypothetical protein [Ignavibacteria bacterium]